MSKLTAGAIGQSSVSSNKTKECPEMAWSEQLSLSKKSYTEILFGGPISDCGLEIKRDNKRQK